MPRKPKFIAGAPDITVMTGHPSQQPSDLHIEGNTSSFDITYRGRNVLLTRAADGGDWHFSEGGESRWIGATRLEWLDALWRGLGMLVAEEAA